MTLTSNQKRCDRRHANRGPRTLVEKVPVDLNRIKFTVQRSHRMLQRNIYMSKAQYLMRSAPVREVEIDDSADDGRYFLRYVLDDTNFRLVVPANNPENVVTVIDLMTSDHDVCKIPLNGKDFKTWQLCMKKIRREMFPRQDVIFTNAHTTVLLYGQQAVHQQDQGRPRNV
mmetsp:Transcript_52818/g.128046  ORF Transcript_52818/g.128046 Transcript_52818/m.128046 type:complete len:171 (+) Transcript_52818:1831-2343(+)